MKKNGVVFREKKKQESEKIYCDICGKEIMKDEYEYVSEISPTIHLCLSCALSDKNIPEKKGMSIYYNNRLYMWVSKGVRGKNNKCVLTGESIPDGTPCWWSSYRDDPKKKNSSYILNLNTIQNPNEFEKGEKTKVCEFENQIKQENGHFVMEDSEVSLWDDNCQPIDKVHERQNMNLFFKQIYGFDESFYEKNKEYVFRGFNKFLLKKFYEFIGEKEKRYVVFYDDNFLFVIDNVRLKECVTDIFEFLPQGIKCNPDEVYLVIPNKYLDEYHKKENKWFRI